MGASPKRPSTVVERRLFDAGATLVAGVDEVGRGAWAGPLSVGVALVDRGALRRLPTGVRDSKLLSPERRAFLYAPICAAVVGFSIGHVSPAECDALGMTAAQSLGARRALEALASPPDAVIVDGRIDFVGAAETVTLVGADRRCRVVAAASVLAKVTRDTLMVELSSTYPVYGFERNKGYISAEHRRAVERHGLSAVHRASWAVHLEDELA